AEIDSGHQCIVEQTCFGIGRQHATGHQPDHLRKADVPNELLDRVAAIPDAAGLHVDNGGAPPVSYTLPDLFGIIGYRHTTSCCFKREISSSVKPSSARMVSVCSPSCGGGASTAGVAPFTLKPVRTTRMSRPIPGTLSKVASMPRVAICGWLKAWATV